MRRGPVRCSLLFNLHVEPLGKYLACLVFPNLRTDAIRSGSNTNLRPLGERITQQCGHDPSEIDVALERKLMDMIGSGTNNAKVITIQGATTGYRASRAVAMHENKDN